MKTFIINLEHATQRWEKLSREACEIGFEVERVPAVFGDELSPPYPDYDESGYHRKHGKRTNRREIGCYQSHLRAMELFLESGDEYGVILEDDVSFKPGAKPTIESAIERGGSRLWDMLRLSGLHSGTPARVAALDEGHALAVNLTRQTGAGAYVVNRRAARRLTEKLLPIALPYDHAFDREWLMGFQAMSLVPYPVEQNARYETSIAHTPKLGPARYLTVFPYRAVNETSRVAYRSLQYARTKTQTLLRAG